MAIKLNFGNKLNKKVSNTILFCDDRLKIKGLKRSSLRKQTENINKTLDLNKNIKDNFFLFNLNPYQKIILVKINQKESTFENEKKGAKFYEFIKLNSILNLRFEESNLNETFTNNKLFLNEFFHGVQLKSYKFEKYKKKFENKILNFDFPKNLKNRFLKNEIKYKSLLEATNFTKDLVSEPGNILHPDEYVKRILKLKSYGLKISVFDKKKLKKMGMNALLGVGQGSIRGSYLVVIEWKGTNKKNKPLAFVGKGVCFDTGGISLKPAKFMEDMTYDMAGSAVVVGLLKNFALRKAKVNAIGVVGLVENMPDGNAQRPGDIVKSYSGKTIEILNTDAEGRLVLADALTYTEKKYNPKFIIDLATLTGAIIVSLGSEYAGLFSNNDQLSNQIFKSGQKVGEKVWRMPLDNNYDKLINSKKADMQNINYVGGAGSTTAAQFLQRFILKDTPWAHLDIAGMAFSKYGGALNSEGATGFGVKLLNQLVEDNYE